jgi:hypothetical protein
MKNIMRWYVDVSLLSDLSMMYIIRVEDTEDKVPVVDAITLARLVK